MYVAYSPFYCQLLPQQTLQLHPWQAHLESFSTPWGVFSLEHGINRRGLRTQTSVVTEVAKYPFHLGSVKQWLQEDQLNSSMPCWGLEPNTSASVV